jgi:hypothetical protein
MTTTPQPDPLAPARLAAADAVDAYARDNPSDRVIPAALIIALSVRAAAPHIEQDALLRVSWYARRVAALEKLLAVYRMSGARPSESLFDELALTSAHIGKQGEWLGGGRAEAVGTEER